MNFQLRDQVPQKFNTILEIRLDDTQRLIFSREQKMKFYGECQAIKKKGHFLKRLYYTRYGINEEKPSFHGHHAPKFLLLKEIDCSQLEYWQSIEDSQKYI